jgi:hypothetical protein
LLRFFHSTPPGLWKEEPIPLPVHPLRDLFNRANPNQLLSYQNANQMPNDAEQK